MFPNYKKKLNNLTKVAHIYEPDDLERFEEYFETFKGHEEGLSKVPTKSFKVYPRKKDYR